MKSWLRLAAAVPDVAFPSGRHAAEIGAVTLLEGSARLLRGATWYKVVDRHAGRGSRTSSTWPSAPRRRSSSPRGRIAEPRRHGRPCISRRQRPRRARSACRAERLAQGRGQASGAAGAHGAVRRHGRRRDRGLARDANTVGTSSSSPATEAHRGRRQRRRRARRATSTRGEYVARSAPRGPSAPVARAPKAFVDALPRHFIDPLPCARAQS